MRLSTGQFVVIEVVRPYSRTTQVTSSFWVFVKAFHKEPFSTEVRRFQVVITPNQTKSRTSGWIWLVQKAEGGVRSSFTLIVVHQMIVIFMTLSLLVCSSV